MICGRQHHALMHLLKLSCDADITQIKTQNDVYRVCAGRAGPRAASGCAPAAIAGPGPER